MKTKLLCVAFFLAPVLGQGHPGHDGHEVTWDFASGAIHPLTSWEHLMLAIAIGFLAAKVGRRLCWCVPPVYVAALTLAHAFQLPASFISHPSQFACGLAATELIIQYSVIVLITSWTRSSSPRALRGWGWASGPT